MIFASVFIDDLKLVVDYDPIQVFLDWIYSSEICPLKYLFSYSYKSGVQWMWK